MVLLELLFVGATALFGLYGAYKLITEYAGREKKVSLREYLGFERKPPREKIRAELREQWLNLAPGEKEIEGVEWEGEIYFETPK